jgi:ATP-dependent helicase/nuclease subunit A
VFAAALADGLTPETAVAGIDPARFVPPLVRLAAVAVPAALRVIPGSARASANPLEADAGESALSLDAAVGTLVHRCLELIARDGLARWSCERVMTLVPAYRRRLVQDGHDNAAAAEGAAVVAAALCRTLDSSAGRWVLAGREGAAAEQAWSSRLVEDGATLTVNHVIDRIFVADGCRWIIDYKTVQAAAEVSPGLLQAKAEEYRPQLERYAGLFAADSLPLRMAIFFPIQGILVELPRK